MKKFCFLLVVTISAAGCSVPQIPKVTSLQSPKVTSLQIPKVTSLVGTISAPPPATADMADMADIADMSVTAALSTPVVATQPADPSTYLGPMPTAVILLQNPNASSDSMERAQEACEQFKTLPTVMDELGSSVTTPNIIATRWLVKANSVPSVDALCDNIGQTYNNDLGNQIIGALRSQGQKSLPTIKSADVNWDGQGPFIAEFFPGGQVITLDGSGEPKGKVGQFIKNWVDQAVAQGEVIQGQSDGGTVADAAKGNSPGTQAAPSDASTATKATGSATAASSGNKINTLLWKNVYGVAIAVLELFPGIGTVVKAATTIIGTACSIVG